MEDINDDARNLAKVGLGILLQKDSSTETGVRFVLRIATLKDHTAWQVWAYLQLTEMFDDGDIEAATRAIAWGKIDATRQKDIVQRALYDYNETRAEIGDPSDIYRADIGDIEKDLSIFERA